MIESLFISQIATPNLRYYFNYATMIVPALMIDYDESSIVFRRVLEKEMSLSYDHFKL